MGAVSGGVAWQGYSGCLECKLPPKLLPAKPMLNAVLLLAFFPKNENFLHFPKTENFFQLARTDASVRSFRKSKWHKVNFE